MSAPAANAPRPRFAGRDFFAVVFGLFLGLAMVKFGNPVILDGTFDPITSLSELWGNPWPAHWGNRLLLPLALAGGWLALTSKSGWPGRRWLWWLPAVWFGWQLVSATQTVDRTLTATTLWHFAGCLACYFIGALVLGRKRALRLVLAGVLAAFAFCLVRAVNQRLFEFPHDRQVLIEGERAGWTNFAPDVFQDLKRNHFIIATNGVDVANPAMLEKLRKGRVHGTMVYPNALAGVVLLLWPLAIVLAFKSAQTLRFPVHAPVIALTLFLGGAGMIWSGSKSGWLIALAISGLWLFRLNWPKRWKWMVAVVVVGVGLGLFAFRFHNYFAAGATSVGARFDYWRAAVNITAEHPLFGSGPGTFQRPYARLKSVDAEMARLTHNDYLEQFSDSGVIGGISYVAWIGCLLATLGCRAWRLKDPLPLAVFVGLLGWFAQGISEFGLYIPALAWTSFSLLGALLGVMGNRR
ncbi:MAG: O-antigen ligase family protein [Verrucomicrobia bacterium]|nr:O-antigen ligase family protein [Verrucomicrobiota bacterium]